MGADVQCSTTMADFDLPDVADETVPAEPMGFEALPDPSETSDALTYVP